MRMPAVMRSSKMSVLICNRIYCGELQKVHHKRLHRRLFDEHIEESVCASNLRDTCYGCGDRRSTVWVCKCRKAFKLGIRSVFPRPFEYERKCFTPWLLSRRGQGLSPSCLGEGVGRTLRD